jgi:hypothetical protein
MIEWVIDWIFEEESLAKSIRERERERERESNECSSSDPYHETDIPRIDVDVMS